MNLLNRINHMSKSEQMDYLLGKLLDDITSATRDEALTLISNLAKGIDPEKFLETFDLKGTYGATGNRPMITVELKDGRGIVIDVNDLTRKHLQDPNAEKEARPIKSFLTQEELDELKNG